MKQGRTFDQRSYLRMWLCVILGENDLGFGGENLLYRRFFRSEPYTCFYDMHLSGFQKSVVFEKTFTKTNTFAFRPWLQGGWGNNCRI